MCPTFSIIVPVYKVEAYLHKCICSLINQTYNNIEIILVDDGSPDNCPKICDDYSKIDKRITVIHKENGGLSDARNAGLSAANGEYIIFVDSDDYIEPETCEKFSEFVGNGYDIIIGECVTGDGNSKFNHISANDHVYKGQEYLLTALKLNKAPMAVWLNIYRKNFLDYNNLKFKTGILHEDEHFTPQAFIMASTVIVTGIKFYNYIIRDASITTKKDKRKNAEDIILIITELSTIYKSAESSMLVKMLCDSLVEKYFHMYRVGNIYTYKQVKIPRKLIWKNAYKVKTKIKAFFFIVNPKLYCCVKNNIEKFLENH